MRQLLLAALIALVTARQLRNPSDNTIRPITVERLDGSAPAKKETGADEDARVPHVAPGDLQAIQERMKEQTAALKSLQTQLDEGLKQKRRLELTQRLVAGLAQLSRADRALANLDAKVNGARESIKRLQDAQVEIEDSRRRAEAENARRAREEDARIEELRKSTAKESSEITRLEAKRKTVAAAVGKWKEYVAQLRDLQQAHTAAANGGGFSSDPTSVPLPPSTADTLASIGLAGAGGLPFPRLAAAEGHAAAAEGAAAESGESEAIPLPAESSEQAAAPGA